MSGAGGSDSHHLVDLVYEGRRDPSSLTRRSRERRWSCTEAGTLCPDACYSLTNREEMRGHFLVIVY
jgi:hypothetical protein